MSDTPREHVVSVRLSDEELARLDQLVQVHEMDRSAVLRRLIGSAELWAWRFEIPLRPKGHYCSCQLIDVSTSPAEPDFVRGRPDGCKVHGVDWDAKVAAAKRRAREA